MERKITYILIFFTIVFLMLSCSVHAANVLIISEEDVVNGKSVVDILTKIAGDENTFEEKQIESSKSLAQTVDGIEVSGKTYDSVIIQLPFDSKESVVDVTSAINTLYTKLGSTENTQYILGTPAGSITEYDKNIVTAKENVKNIMTGMTAKKVASIPVYENLKKAQDNSLEMYSNGKITPLGNLLVACTYYNSLGKKVFNLSSYEGVTDAEVEQVVQIANDETKASMVGTELDVSTQKLELESKETIDKDIEVAGKSEVADRTSSTAQKKTTGKGALNVSKEVLNTVTFRADREPRLNYIVDQEYLYIEIRDCAGVACEFPSENGNDVTAAQKSQQPKIYYYKNDKRGAEVKNVKRPNEADYKRRGLAYFYTIGLPVSEIGEDYTKFEIVARDVKTPETNRQYYIDEIFMVKKTNDGSLKVNRAPTAGVGALKTNMSQMGLLVNDATGVSMIELKSLPKSVGKANETIRKWNGSVQDNWRMVTAVTTDNKYVKNGITKCEKIDTIFKKTSWKGLNPKLAGKDGDYIVMITAADASGASSTKTMHVDVRYYWVSENSYAPTGNGTIEKSKNWTKTNKNEDNGTKSDSTHDSNGSSGEEPDDGSRDSSSADTATNENEPDRDQGSTSNQGSTTKQDDEKDEIRAEQRWRRENADQ